MKVMSPRVMRRSIGKVTIFDLLGCFQKSPIDAVYGYVEAYIKECHFQNIVLNLEKAEGISCSHIETLAPILDIPKKSAIYHSDGKNITRCHKGKKDVVLCNTVPEILAIFGDSLIEQEKSVAYTDRRKSLRLKTAIPAHIEFAESNALIHASETIITNMSLEGLFLECFDLHDAEFVESLDSFQTLSVNLSMPHPTKKSREMFTTPAHIIRIECTGKQVGIALKLHTPLSM